MKSTLYPFPNEINVFYRSSFLLSFFANDLAYEHSILSNKLIVKCKIIYLIFLFSQAHERLILMSLVEKIKMLCKEQKITVAELERKTGISNGQIRKWDVSTPGIDKLERIADYFDVSVDYLLGRTDKKRYYDLTEKDERDIQKELKKIINGEDVDNAFAAFDGRVLEDLSEEDRELLIASWENTLRLTKRIAKQKFTPKKYRK